MTNALFGYWYLRGYLTEGMTWLELALARAAGTPSVDRSKAYNRLGLFAMGIGDLLTAKLRFEESLRICRIVGSMEREAAAIGNLSRVAMQRNDFDEARRLMLESVERFRRMGDTFHEAYVVVKLGELAAEEGDEQEAIERFTEATRLYQAIGNEAQWANVQRCIAQSLYRSGQGDTARHALRVSLAHSAAVEDRAGVASLLAYLGASALDEQDPTRAARLLGASHALHVAPADREPLRRDWRLQEKAEAAVRASLSEEVFQTAWREGAQLNRSAAVAYALEREA